MCYIVLHVHVHIHWMYCDTLDYRSYIHTYCVVYVVFSTTKHVIGIDTLTVCLPLDATGREREGEREGGGRRERGGREGGGRRERGGRERGREKERKGGGRKVLKGGKEREKEKEQERERKEEWLIHSTPYSTVCLVYWM